MALSIVGVHLFVGFAILWWLVFSLLLPALAVFSPSRRTQEESAIERTGGNLLCALGWLLLLAAACVLL